VVGDLHITIGGVTTTVTPSTPLIAFEEPER